MQSRWLWKLATVVLLPFLLASNPSWAEPRIKVQSTDKAGIEKIVKQSEGAVMVVLAAWCFPCRQELPTLIKLYDKYKSQGLEMVGISVDFGGPSMIQPLLDKEHVNFPVYWVDEQVVRDLNIRGIPLLFLVRDGEIIQEVVGKQSEAFLEKKIAQLLRGPEPPSCDESERNFYDEAE
jgi:thiol-disulfide isomerase/thioredoxin